MFHNLKDVGFLQVKVIRAEALMAADVTGKDSLCFCDSLIKKWIIWKMGQFQQNMKFKNDKVSELCCPFADNISPSKKQKFWNKTFMCWTMSCNASKQNPTVSMGKEKYTFFTIRGPEKTFYVVDVQDFIL